MDKLYSKIDNDFLKKLKGIVKNLNLMLLVKQDSNLSIHTKYGYLNIPSSTNWHTSKGKTKENLEIIQMMNEHIQEVPTIGILTIQSMLKDQEIRASHERVRLLMRKANIRGIYPRKHLTILGEKLIHIKYT